MDLPADILEKVIEFETAEKLNPPMEKRKKAISIGEIEKEQKRINQDMEGKGVIIDSDDVLISLNGIPLYKGDE